MKKVLMGFALLASISLVGCVNQKNVNIAENNPNQTANTNKLVSPTKANNSIVYENTKYGFKISLPKGWNGYKIINDKWEGLAFEESAGQKVTQTGPMISIRHPEWTAKSPRQDIPIMIFTIPQWNLLQQDKFHIGAAPIGPRELGRNSKYVFALPARYNFAFPTGYEEVENILNSKAFQAIEIK